MKVELLRVFGNDKMVVDAARISYNRVRPDWSEARDTVLIDKLAKNGHWSPFYHPKIQLRVTAPIFVARQLHRHKVGFEINEESRRYTDANLNFQWPWISPESAAVFQEVEEWALSAYNTLRALGVPREQARSVLPLSLGTTWIWTGSLFGYARLCKERLAADAQRETQEVAMEINTICKMAFPVSWAALRRNL